MSQYWEKDRDSCCDLLLALEATGPDVGEEAPEDGTQHDDSGDFRGGSSPGPGSPPAGGPPSGASSRGPGASGPPPKSQSGKSKGTTKKGGGEKQKKDSTGKNSSANERRVGVFGNPKGLPPSIKFPTNPP